MKKGIMILLLAGFCVVVFAQNEGDFRIDRNGTITAYEGWSVEVVIPAQIGGVPVRAVGDGVFRNMGLTEITLPAGITHIGNNAFAGNKLTTVAIHNGVFVGERAFANNQLTSLTIGRGVTVGNFAFERNQLTEFTMGNGGSVGFRAFLRNNLSDYILGAGIQVDDSSFVFSETNNIGYFVYCEYMLNDRKAGTYSTAVTDFDKSEGDYRFYETRYGSVIIRYTGNEGNRLIIPGTLGGAAVKGIGREAFSGKNISRVQLPEDIAFIDREAFSGNQMTSVTIPGSVFSIGYRAFSGNKLSSVTLSPGVASIGYLAFFGNPLATVAIGDNVLFAGDFSFDNNFDNLYNTNGKKAGVYGYNNLRWSMITVPTPTVLSTVSLLPGVPPDLRFNVSVNGQTYGPYDMNAFAQMAGSGQVNAQSMVWRKGMSDWQEAGVVPELVHFFPND